MSQNQNEQAIDLQTKKVKKKFLPKRKKKQVMTLEAKREKIKQKLHEYFKDAKSYFDFPYQGVIFPQPDCAADHIKSIFDYYCHYGFLPIFSAIWAHNPSGTFLFKKHQIDQIFDNFDQAKEDLVNEYQKDIREGQTIYIATYYLEIERVRFLRITKDGYDEFISKFIDQETFYSNYDEKIACVRAKMN